MVSGQFGMEATCTSDTSIPLSKQLEKAIFHIEGSIDEVEFDELDDELTREAIPADPSVKITVTRSWTKGCITGKIPL